MTLEITSADLEELPWIDSAYFLEEIPSTNTYALEHLSQFKNRLPCLIVAKKQVAGRGRGQNRWWSQPGSLTCSLVLSSDQIPSAHQSKLAFTTALAVDHALNKQLSLSLPLQFKWPNDLYVEEKKLGGILIENSSGYTVIGLGLNINQDWSLAPIELQQSATSIFNMLKQQSSFHQILKGYLESMQQLLQQPADRIIPQWQEKSLLNDRIVTIQTPKEELCGRCLGINLEGHLLLMTTRGIEEIIAGSILNFE